MIRALCSRNLEPAAPIVLVTAPLRMAGLFKYDCHHQAYKASRPVFSCVTLNDCMRSVASMGSNTIRLLRFGGCALQVSLSGSETTREVNCV